MVLKKIYSSIPSWNHGPTKYWRKANVSSLNTVSRNNIPLPMSTPGGYGSKIECDDTSGIRSVLVQEVISEPFGQSCQNEINSKSRLRHTGTKVKNSYSMTTSEYLQRKKKDFTYNSVKHECSPSGTDSAPSIGWEGQRGATSNGSHIERLKMNAISATCKSTSSPCHIYYKDNNTLPANVNKPPIPCVRRRGSTKNICG